MTFRKLAASAMAVLMLSASCVMPASAENEINAGDADCSGSVNVADAVLLARYCAEDSAVHITAQGRLNADLNGDSSITAEDTAMLLRVLAGLSELPPAEFRAKNLLDGITVGELPAAENTGKAFASAQDDFAARLLQACAEAKPGENIMISPVSVALALGMTANGADGQTLTEMANVLGCWWLAPESTEGDAEEPYPPVELLRLYNIGCYDWLHTQGEELKPANSVWCKSGDDRLDVPADFLKTVKTYYDAEVYSAPFDDSTVADVNAWCSQKTGGMIPKIIKELDANAVMMLINALCFEADWSHPYSEYAVHEGKFTNADGSVTTADLMYGEEYSYFDDGMATGFGKAYAGGQYRFVGVLPNEDVAMDDYLKTLMRDGGLQKLLGSETSEEVYTALPKFSFSYSESLCGILSALGMPTAFDDSKADFSRLNTAAPSYIGDVIHKTFIDLNESGTRAAAATAVIIDVKGAPGEPKRVYLDRPFVFLIVDDVNGGIPVFAGVVNTL